MKHIIRVEILENLPEIRPLIAMDRNKKFFQEGKKKKPVVPDDEIWYTSSDGNIVKPYRASSLPEIDTNIYSDGKGVIKFKTDITSIGNLAFRICSNLASIEIPNSVTSIGEGAFRDCAGLTTIDIPNSVTSIGTEAFCNSGLTTIVIPNSVISIESGAFYNCSNLTSVTIPNSVTSIGGSAFRSTGLISVTIPNSVTSIGIHNFSYCSSLTSVTIPNSITSIGDYAFRNCNSLTSVTIPNSVTSIGKESFYNCSSLTSVTINSNDIINPSISYTESNNIGTIFGSQVENYIIGNGITSIGEMAFYNCSSLTSVTINSNDIINPSISYTESNNIGTIFGSQVENYIIGNGITSIGSFAFYDCTGLASIVIPDSITSIGANAFNSCTTLTSITIPNNVTRIGYHAFYGCAGLTTIIVENGNSFYDSRNNCNAIIETATNILIVGCKNTIIPNSITHIGEEAFEGCTGLTSMTIPNSVISIGGSAFRDCAGLTTITIPNSITNIGGYAFSGCESLTGELVIPNGIESIGNSTFRKCSSLTSITIPDSVESIGDYAFNDCSGLTSVNIPNSVESIGEYAFYNCTGLTSMTIPNSVTIIERLAFYNVLNIVYTGTAAGSPWGAKNMNGYVDDYLVYSDATKTVLLGCSTKAIGEIIISNSATSIGENAFSGCTGLTSITIPNSVTSIGENAFSGCTGLTSITIPNSVTSIGQNAFGQISAKILFSKLYSTYTNKLFSTPSSQSATYTYNVEFNISEIPADYNISSMLPQVANNGKGTLTYNIYTDYASCKDQALALVTQKTIVNVYHIDGTSWE